MLNLLKNINPILNPSQVGYLIFFVTNVCNFRCDFCYLTSEQLADKNKIDLELLDQRLLEVSNYQPIKYIDLYTPLLMHCFGGSVKDTNSLIIYCIELS